jgi:hypothetical protein
MCVMHGTSAYTVTRAAATQLSLPGVGVPPRHLRPRQCAQKPEALRQESDVLLPTYLRRLAGRGAARKGYRRIATNYR